MSTGFYTTTDPNIRIRVEQDDDFYDDPDYAPGVGEELLACHEAGDVYGVIVEKRYKVVRTDMENAETEERYEWDEEESIWSCAGYNDVAVEVAKEFFGITVTGRA